MARPPVTPDPAADATIVPITLRLYCHGLGDCLLVSLPVADGGPPFRLLIDCGIHSASRAGPARITAVVDDLAAACEGRIDAIVGTHEHWDHLSGFLTARDRFVDAETPGLADDDPRIRVGEVWLAWTENPDDAMGSAIDRYKDAGQETLVGLRLAMAAAPAESLPDGLADGMDGLFGFLFGAQPGQRVRSAREALRGLVPAARVRYLEPGSLVPLPERVGDVRIHVLGPPRDPALLRVHDDPDDGYKLAFGNHPETLALATALAIADGTLDLRDDPAAPFDAEQGVPLSALRNGTAGDAALRQFLDRHYLAGDAGRRIDSLWLSGAGDLALQLDRNTNNTSLVLAVERMSSGNVLLFAADAQAGNWQSWDAVTVPLGSAPDAPRRTGPDLLARTVFYKVGHHGSGNATLRARGLDRMDSGKLVAFNPTDTALATRLGWRNFPALSLVTALGERSHGRYIQSDADWLRAGAAPPFTAGGALVAAPRSGHLALPAGTALDHAIGWVEIDIA